MIIKNQLKIIGDSVLPDLFDPIDQRRNVSDFCYFYIANINGLSCYKHKFNIKIEPKERKNLKFYFSTYITRRNQLSSTVNKITSESRG